MHTKLTLNIDRQIIEEAKKYAKSNNSSLSKLIENYLQSITYKKNDKVRVSPLVESLTGILPADITSTKKDYVDYLEKKYQ